MGTLSFQKLYCLGYRKIRGNTQKHMYVIPIDCSGVYRHLLALRYLTQ